MGMGIWKYRNWSWLAQRSPGTVSHNSFHGSFPGLSFLMHRCWSVLCWSLLSCTLSGTLIVLVSLVLQHHFLSLGCLPGSNWVHPLCVETWKLSRYSKLGQPQDPTSLFLISQESLFFIAWMTSILKSVVLYVLYDLFVWEGKLFFSNSSVKISYWISLKTVSYGSTIVFTVEKISKLGRNRFLSLLVILTLKLPLPKIFSESVQHSRN